MVIRHIIHQTSVSGVICMMELLVVTALGLIVLLWRATIKTTAPNRTRVMLAGKYCTIEKEASSFLMLIEQYLPG